MKLADHPTVRHFHENANNRPAPPTALDAAWLRQLCLHYGADDAGWFSPGQEPEQVRDKKRRTPVRRIAPLSRNEICRDQREDRERYPVEPMRQYEA